MIYEQGCAHCPMKALPSHGLIIIYLREEILGAGAACLGGVSHAFRLSKRPTVRGYKDSIQSAGVCCSFPLRSEHKETVQTPMPCASTDRNN